MANIGIGALPVHVAQREVDRGMLRQLPPYDDLPAVDVYLIKNPKRRLSEAEAELLQMCKKDILSLPMQERTFSGNQPVSG